MIVTSVLLPSSLLYPVLLSVTQCSWVFLSVPIFIFVICNLIPGSCNQSRAVNKTTAVFWFCFCVWRSKTTFILTYFVSPQFTETRKTKTKHVSSLRANITCISTEALSQSRTLFFLRRSRLEAVTTDKSSPRDEPTISCGGEYVLDHIYWHDTQWLGHPAVHTTVHTTTTTIHFLTGTHTQTFFTKK